MVSVVGKRLSDFPEIAAQLDAERNGDVTAAEIVAGSQKKYWWRCDKGPDHVWATSPSNRTRSGHGCPCCFGRQVSVTNSLAALYPAVAVQLDPERNGPVTAEEIPAGSHVKYWWRCDKGSDHMWQAVVGSRTQGGKGCPFCAGRQASVTNSLAALYPEIAAQLDAERNGGITAEEIPGGSGTKYWWRCDKGPDHVWETSVDERTSRASGCPCCIGHRASITNSLIALYPDVASQLDPVLNGGVVVAEIVAGSNKKYWWRCDKGPDHVWEESVTDRTKSGHSCPSCPGRQVSTVTRMPSLASYPDIASQLDEDLNGGVSADQISGDSPRKYWWRCDKGPDHVWEASVVSRTRLGAGCPCCFGRQASVTNSLAVFYPEVAAQLDAERNGGITAEQIPAGSEARYWWRCDEGPDHVWEAVVSSRTRLNAGCPCCSGRQVSVTNSLAVFYPEIAAQFDSELNGGITAQQIPAGSQKKYWWRCDKGPDHVWETSPGRRTGSEATGCPCCRGLQVSVTNSLAVLYPEIAAQLDPGRNDGVTAAEIVAGSNKKYWWRCDKGPDHVWEAVVFSRTRAVASGCPRCSTGWTVQGLREFLVGLRDHLRALPPQDLYAICRSNGLLRSSRSEFAKRLLTGEISAEELDAFIDGRRDPPMLDTTLLAGFEDEFEGALGSGGGSSADVGDFGDEEIDAEVAVGTDDVGGDEPPLPLVSSDGILAAAGAIVFADSDDETVDYLVASAVARIWGHAYRNEAAALAETGTQRSDVYAERVRQTFRAQHDAALSLPIPDGYDFRPGSGVDVALPNLMQRRVASQVVTERRVGNWSGTGAGKTLSAVLSSRAIGATSS